MNCRTSDSRFWTARVSLRPPWRSLNLCLPLICFTTADATGVPTQFIESEQLYRAGNCRAFRNPDGSEKCKSTSQFVHRSDSIGREVGGFNRDDLYLLYRDHRGLI